MRTDGCFYAHGARPSMLFPALLAVSAMILPGIAASTTIRIEIPIASSVTDVWAAVRDVGAVSTRLAPGFVVNAQFEGDVRAVTFANGAVVHEKIVSIDHQLHRLGYSAIDGLPTFHFASIEVVPSGQGM